MSHYFTDNRQLPQNRKEISFRFSGFIIPLITDNGVFCKGEVDFGSYVLLKTIKEEPLGDHILDLGGLLYYVSAAVIGVTVKKLFPDAEMLMVDVNPRAVELAVLNAQKNSVEAEVRVSDIFENVTETLSDILTNPPIRAGKKVIYAMFEQAYDHLRPQGHLYVVIRKQQGALSAKAKIEELFGNCEVINKEKGYYILKSTKTD